MQKLSDFYFLIIGAREEGIYTILEYNDGKFKWIGESHGLHKGGLQRARHIIGEKLLNQNYPLNQEIEHICIKPGREDNRPEKWTVQELLDA